MNTTIIYNPQTDNPSYDDLIHTNVVLNHTGEVSIRIPQEIPTSIPKVGYTTSGRGYYRGWISNLQKSIRRGDVTSSIQSAHECFQMGGPFRSNVVNRVCKVILSEDIGLCASADLIESCMECIISPSFDLLSTIIRQMCSGYKSRIVDHSIHLFLRPSHVEEESFDVYYTRVKTILIEHVQEENSISLDTLHKYAICVNGCVQKGEEKINTLFTNTILSVSKLNKRGPFGKIYLLWNLLYSSAHTALAKKSIVNLFIIWCHHKSSESILNVLHAAFLVLFKLDNTSLTQLTETISNEDQNKTVWISSAAYDKHVMWWKGESSFRNTISFFLRYGCKLDKIHPGLKHVEEEMYAQLVEKNSKK